MKEAADRLFTESYKSDVLGGVADHTGGRARKYFTKLDAKDRTLVKWYLTQGIGPHQTEYYISDLAREYAVIDPERKNKKAIKSAHKEIKRIERFLEIFLASNKFFPAVRTFIVPVQTEPGKVEFIKEAGWTRYGSTQEDLRSDRRYVRKSILPFLPIVHAFLDDPKGSPMYFNQAEIMEKFQQRKERTA